MLFDFEKNVDYEYAAFGHIIKRKAIWEYADPPMDDVEQVSKWIIQ